MKPQITELARRNHTTILKCMAAVSQKVVAELIEVSETTVSRIKAEDLEQLAAILAALNLSVVPQTRKTVDPDRLRAITILAREALEHEAGSTDWGELS